MKLLCITEPRTHPSFDTTVSLYSHFAESSDIQLFHALSTSVSADSNVPVVAVPGALRYEEFLALEHAETTDLAWEFFDVAFCRTDKPRPPKFHDFLETHANVVRFVNQPRGVEEAGSWDFSQKVVAGHLPDHIFSRDKEEIADFFGQHGTIVAKQSGSYGGREVSKITRSGAGYTCDNIVRGLQEFSSLDGLIDELLSRDANAFQFVRYLKNIGAGDKRVLVVDGEIYGGYVRKSASEGWVHNISAGGTAELSEIGSREKEVIADTVPAYRQLGINTLGYDFLMDDDGSWILSEINAGNIGGYNRLEELGAEGILDRLSSWILSFAAATQK